MIDKVRKYIEREVGALSDALADGAMVLVALSGGADSTALLLVLKELGYRLHALHCNFHLRGDESDSDQAFVEELCQRNSVPLSVRHFETEEEAKRRGISIEMAARDLRYDWFREELKARKASCVAVAHHRDDQAETLLLNLVRGTGLRGLAGISPCAGDIVRPLLCLTQNEIVHYLESRGQTYVTDSTNQQCDAAQRNRIRLDIVPLLNAVNPKASEHLAQAGDIVRDSLFYYQKGIDASFRELGITASSFPLTALDEPTLLHEWLSDKGFNSSQEQEMLESASRAVGKMWHSPSYIVLRDRDSLLLKLADHPIEPPLLKQEIVDRIGETGPYVAYFDADLLAEPLVCRPVQTGDAFVPFGMKGRKLVSDYLTDVKLNRFEKQQQFVAVCNRDIVWLIGHRSDNRFRVTDRTRRILKVSVAL